MGEMSSEGANLGAGIDLSQFYQVFFEEAGENLDNMEQLLLNVNVEEAPLRPNPVVQEDMSAGSIDLF